MYFDIVRKAWYVGTLKNATPTSGVDKIIHYKNNIFLRKHFLCTIPIQVKEYENNKLIEINTLQIETNDKLNYVQ